ncbi:hypothetical protein [Microvirga flavescens]|uniref:hypothetical protein n=1 Tax=Microvirga flavescens TaxID=2249811 RepID=UPI000DD8D272|nr:hypothetical protein [Microvirga flavescens]
MRNGLCALPAALAALILSACTQTGASAPPSPVNAATGCQAEIEEYRAIMENDRRMGHVNASVYNRVEADIGKASAACAAGRDAEARRMISATKSRYGYR